MILPTIPCRLEATGRLETIDVDFLISAAQKCSIEILIDVSSGQANESKFAMRLAGFQWEFQPDSPIEKVFDTELNGYIGSINFVYSIIEIGCGWESKPEKYKQRLTDLLACVPLNFLVKSGQTFTAVADMLKTLVMYECLVKKHVLMNGEVYVVNESQATET